MSGIPSNYPVGGPQNTPTGNFTDQAFSQLGDAAWEAIKECQANPNAVNIQTAMQCINALNAYLSANPPPAGDPQYSTAMAIQAAFGQYGGMVGETLAQVCQMFGTSSCMNAVEVFQGQTSLFTPLYNALDQIQTTGSQNNDGNNPDVQADINQLLQDLSIYDSYDRSNPNQSELNDYLLAIAGDINKLETDVSAASPPITDGYLTVLLTYINTPTQIGDSSTSLVALCSGLTSSSPQSAFDALDNALENVGAQQSGGGAFQDLINQTLYEEYD